MPIPLRTRAFWAVYRRLEFLPPMQQTGRRVRIARGMRRRAIALPGMTLVAGRRDRSVAALDSAIELPDGVRLPVRIYRPLMGTYPLPVVVNFHGGGWISGDARQSEWWASAVAARAGALVVSVDYRLAPEDPFPAAPEDCYAATCWVAENAARLGADPARLAVMGDSAGGNLAAVVTLLARDRGGPGIAAQVLVYPSVDLVRDWDSYAVNADAPVLTRRDIEMSRGQYVRDDADRRDPRASPLLAGHHRDLPPALIQTAEFDPLRDHGPAYAAALRAAGVDATHTDYAGAVHGYASLPGVVPAGRPALAEAAAFLRQHLS